MQAVPSANQSQLRWRSWSSLVLLALLLLYALLCVKRSEGKPLWFDELGTLNVASQSTLSGMFRVEPADGNPPLQYLLVRSSLHLFGTTAFTLRLPAMLGAGLAIVCVFVFIARRFGGGAGLLGATLLLFSPVSDYGVEARPYALLLGFVMLMLVLWQSATMASRRTGALVGLAVTIFALTITQPFGVLWAALPLSAAEAVRWWQTRQVDRRMLLAVLLGFLGFAITAHFGHETHRVLAAPAGSQHPTISLPTPAKLKQTLRLNGVLPPALLLLPTGTFTWWMRRRQVTHNATASEWAAATTLGLSMFVIYAITVLVTHYFWGRYLLPGVLGWFLVLAMACGTIHRRSVTIVVLVLGLALILNARRPRPGDSLQLPWPQRSADTLLTQGDPIEPIVIENAVLYPQVWWYSKPALRTRLHYVADAPHAMATGDFMGDLTLIAMHNAGSPLFPTDTLSQFLGQHRCFLLWQGTIHNGDWLSDALRAQHYEFRVVAKDGSGDTLLDVSAPATRCP